MKQILQNLKDGTVEVAEVPSPQVRPGHLLIRTTHSLISAGTERMLVEFGSAGLLAKARKQPEKVRQVLDKAKTDGLGATLQAVSARLDEPMTLGYCNAGTVIAGGDGVTAFRVGDRVASNGPHAEIVCVPVNLCAGIPAAVTNEEAAFTSLAAIALQGVRLIEPTLGEIVVVTGLGLVGLLAVQILQANGCKVIGFDFPQDRVDLARSFGAEAFNLSDDADAVKLALAASRGRGVDAVLITASTASNEPVNQAADMCRKRGRVVLVGVTGLELSRSKFYEKEISFQVSCSYGPGRYDEEYEARGCDYPLGFVRWTEGRNLEAVLDLLADKRLQVAPLISHRIPIADAQQAYANLSHASAALAMILEYPPDPMIRTADDAAATTVVLKSAAAAPSPAPGVVGIIGAGAFTKLTLLPAISAAGPRLKTIASRSGVSGTHLARKFGFEQTTTDYQTLLADPAIDTVFITTRHHQHAPMAVAALEAGKHVFVEKPVAIDREGLETVREAVQSEGGRQFMVGFNRRFSPLIVKARELLAGRSRPLAMRMTVNAGAVARDHWIHDPQVGGGRIIGEACHFVDLLASLAGCPIVEVSATAMGAAQRDMSCDDTVTISLAFADGSVGAIDYFSNGHKGFPKETLSVFSEERILVLENFRRLRGYGWRGFKAMRLRQQDKGHTAEVREFLDGVKRGAPALIPFDQIYNVTLATLSAVESTQTGGRIVLA